MRVVVVQPDRLSRKMLNMILVDAGHQTVMARNAAEAVNATIGRETDAVIVETDLPDGDGCDLCMTLRAEQYRGPLIVISREQATETKLRAFAVGVDDYLVEPFHAAELVARLEAVARRYRIGEQSRESLVLRAGGCELAISDLAFRADGQPEVELTPTEMRILECLMRNSPITVSRDTLIQRVWGYDLFGDTNRVTVYIRRLRAKIERNPENPRYLHTVRGIGYAFRPISTAGNGASRPIERPAPAHAELAAVP